MYINVYINVAVIIFLYNIKRDFLNKYIAIKLNKFSDVISKNISSID